MLTLENLRIVQGTFALFADFSVAPGSRVAVVGPSGAGKSTLISAIAGFVEPTAGRILWDGADLADRAPMARPISILFQDGNLFPHLTAFQNVALGLSPRLRLGAPDRDAVAAALASVGLAGMEERKPGRLSGGQQSRVAIARLLVRKRPLVLLDEPFAALGPALRGALIDLLHGLDATQMMITHDVADARRFATHVVWVDEGEATAPVPVAQFFENPPPGLARYTG